MELAVAGVMFAALVAYALTGGADFGGGVWDLLAYGPRARQQRDAIEKAIGPIWEANHVWLILVIVLLFVAFPTVFSAVSIALHIPLTLMLFGIVLRGSSFVFRHYDVQDDVHHGRWSFVFAGSSVYTPIMLGVCTGAVASGSIRIQDGQVVTDYVSSWLAPFPFAVGLFTLALFAFLAAVYLAADVEDPALQEDFRRRAIVSAIAVAFFAWVAFLLAGNGAPQLARGLTLTGWAIPFQLATAAVGLNCLWALRRRRFRQARIVAMLEVTLVIAGWGLAQFPYILPPDVTITSAAAPASVLGPVLLALGIGGAFLLPTYLWMMSVFRGVPAK